MCLSLYKGGLYEGWWRGLPVRSWAANSELGAPTVNEIKGVINYQYPIQCNEQNLCMSNERNRYIYIYTSEAAIQCQEYNSHDSSFLHRILSLLVYIYVVLFFCVLNCGDFTELPVPYHMTMVSWSWKRWMPVLGMMYLSGVKNKAGMNCNP